jgi:hypothetical protein
MPKIGFYKNLIFYIVSQDINERWHLHVSNSRNYVWPAKIWLDDASVFEPGGLSEQELILASKLVDSNREAINNILQLFRDGKKTKSIKFQLK